MASTGRIRFVLIGLAFSFGVLLVAACGSGNPKPDAVQRVCMHAVPGESDSDLRLWNYNPVQMPDPNTWNGNGQYLFGDGVTMTFRDYRLVGSNCGLVNGKPLGGI